MESDARRGGHRYDPLAGTRFTRRRFLALSAMAGATLLSACGGGSSGTTPAPTSASGAATSAAAPTPGAGAGSTAASPATGGAASPVAASPAATTTTAAAGGTTGGTKVFHYAVTRDIVVMDPAKITSAVDYDLSEAIYNYPARYTYTPPLGTTINPELTTWEIDPQAKTFTFHLKPNVTFHGDYGAMTSDDLAWNWNRIKDPKTGSPYELDFSGSTITTPDPQTVVVTFDHPNPIFIEASLAFRPGMIMSKKAFEATSQNWKQKPIGSGPFEWVQWQPGSQVTLKRFEGYWGTKPKVDQIICKMNIDDRAAVLAVSKGELDAYYINSPDVALDTKKNPPPNTKFMSGDKGIIPMWTTFNLKRTPFQDLRVRQAFQYAMDKDSIAKDLYGGLATPLWSFLPPFMPGYTEDVQKYPYNPDKAKQLLKEANYPFDSFTPSVLTDSGLPDQVNGSNMIQQYMANVGVKVKIDLEEKGNFAQKSAAGDFDMYTISISRISPDQLATPQFHSGSPGNYSFYTGADSLIDQAKAEPDPNKRNQLYVQLQQKLAQDLPVVFLISLTSYLIINTNRITGGVPGAGWQSRFDWFNVDVPAT